MNLKDKLRLKQAGTSCLTPIKARWDNFSPETVYLDYEACIDPSPPFHVSRQAWI